MTELVLKIRTFVCWVFGHKARGCFGRGADERRVLVTCVRCGARMILRDEAKPGEMIPIPRRWKA